MTAVGEVLAFRRSGRVKGAKSRLGERGLRFALELAVAVTLHAHNSAAPGYERRRPEQTLLYQTVAQHWQTFVAQADATEVYRSSWYGKSISEFLRGGEKNSFALLGGLSYLRLSLVVGALLGLELGACHPTRVARHALAGVGGRGAGTGADHLWRAARQSLARSLYD